MVERRSNTLNTGQERTAEGKQREVRSSRRVRRSLGRVTGIREYSEDARRQSAGEKITDEVEIRQMLYKEDFISLRAWT